MQEIARLLDALVHDRYEEVSPDSYPDADHHQLIRLINALFQHKRLREIIETTPGESASPPKTVSLNR